MNECVFGYRAEVDTAVCGADISVKHRYLKDISLLNEFVISHHGSSWRHMRSC